MNHNDPGAARAYTRRAFLQHGTLFASAALTVPAFLQNAAFALPRPAPGLDSIPGVDEDRVLVVIQLSGGNDGLNTVVPFRDDAYYNARRTIAVKPHEVHRLSRNGPDLGLHPAMGSLRTLYDEGLCAIVQSVGYPNPNRSHFASMDVWHTAETSGTGDGWIGRYFDAQCCGHGTGNAQQPPAQPAQPPIAIGADMPLALQGRRVMPLTLESPETFRWAGDHRPALAEAYEQLLTAAPAPDDDTPAAFLLRTALDARVSSDTIRHAVAAPPLVKYPGTPFAGQLAMVASMIRAGLKTRVYYVSLGGFDTHAAQGGAQGRHAGLLAQLSDGVRAFYQDLAAQGNAGRVLSVCFSEFGRRVGQNASGGTDHGTAAPMFLFGPMVRAGITGPNPDLRNLDAGDLRFTIDFRQVYAELLDRWLATDSQRVLGGRYRHTGVLAKA